MRSLLLSLLLVLACGDDDASTDAGIDGAFPDADIDSGPPQCLTNADCDDGTYCNGEERCDQFNPDADDRGCLPPLMPPCELERCVEDEDRCLTDCDLTGDMDMDGAVSPACGGADCDDMDPNVFPGNPEDCDGEDQDCDERIDEGAIREVFVDGDGDGFGSGEPMMMCPGEGFALVGGDCDDAVPSVNPGAPEVCDDPRDEDCDMAFDEGC